ncbi:Fur-regulated basic protein FbpA [Mesobacillus maritimus]|uniref:Fur-regulated basic protein FbpA n=1 Tax=Mesobacillus maritimus TaxID=1643336 RepID=A0ABS7K4S6_9BACI|nr:Fur-regulated basic protein FbpA [Mesobacillus maritimus]MBY0097240.1 Fur-regulated basic protein FbpA [Mesobacillus maritimus]
MNHTLRYTVQIKKEKLINKMIQSGIFKKGNKHLYELSLTDLEEEYKNMERDNGTDSLPRT